MLVNEIFVSHQGEVNVGKFCAFLRLGKCNLKCSFCFGIKSGRRIPKLLTINKNINIDKVNIGDKILTFDEKQNLVETEVKEVFSREVDEWYEIKINNKIYFVTTEHPFFTKRGMIKVNELKIGDVILHLTNAEKMSFRMKHKNPMFNNISKQKRLENIDYNIVAKKVSKTRKDKFNQGIIKLPIMSERAKEKLSLRMKINNPMFYPENISKVKKTMKEKINNGFKYPIKTIEQRKHYSLSKLGDKNPMKRKEVMIKNFLNHIHGKAKTELWFEKFCLRHNININYIGDGKLFIGNKCPDFIIPNTKKLIEIYASTYLYSNKQFRDIDWVNNRTEYFKNYGYDCLCLDSDTFRNFNEDKILNTIKIYIHNGFEVQQIKYINRFDSIYKYDYFKPKKLKVYNIKCKPYDTYIIDNMWVHNCDTNYAKDIYTELSINEIIEKVCVFPRVVITGGEPFLQMEEVVKLCNRLTADGIIVEFETNGTIKPKGFNNLNKVIFNVSPKLKNSGNDYNMRIRPLVLNWFIRHNANFKFVVNTKEDIDEINMLVNDNKIPKELIYFMPLGATKEEQLEKMEQVIIWAKAYGVNFSPRLHILIWGTKRGV